jgi:hypothetical protein
MRKHLNLFLGKAKIECWRSFKKLRAVRCGDIHYFTNSFCKNAFVNCAFYKLFLLLTVVCIFIACDILKICR